MDHGCRTPEVPPEAAYDEARNGSSNARSTPARVSDRALDAALTHDSGISEPM